MSATATIAAAIPAQVIWCGLDLSTPLCITLRVSVNDLAPES